MKHSFILRSYNSAISSRAFSLHIAGDSTLGWCRPRAIKEKHGGPLVWDQYITDRRNNPWHDPGDAILHEGFTQKHDKTKPFWKKSLTQSQVWSFTPHIGLSVRNQLIFSHAKYIKPNPITRIITMVILSTQRSDGMDELAYVHNCLAWLSKVNSVSPSSCHRCFCAFRWRELIEVFLNNYNV